jgi:hypothetical protein
VKTHGEEEESCQEGKEGRKESGKEESGQEEKEIRLQKVAVESLECATDSAVPALSGT